MYLEIPIQGLENERQIKHIFWWTGFFRKKKNGRCQSSGDVTTGTLYRVYVRSDTAKEHILGYDVRTLWVSHKPRPFTGRGN